LRMTRRGYLRAQMVVALLLLAMLAVAIWLRLAPPDLAGLRLIPELEELLRALLRNAVWGVLIVAAAEALETVWVLRKFARAESAPPGEPKGSTPDPVS